MEEVHATRLATLGHPQRLAVFRLLMRRYPDAVPAGEVAQALGLKPSTLSAYLGALMQAGLVTQTRDGTSLRYSMNMPELRRLFDYLLNDCCRGRPDLCAPAPTQGGDPDMADRKYNALFICEGNSARSIFAETILRDLAGDRFNAYSAGTKPVFRIEPLRARGAGGQGPRYLGAARQARGRIHRPRTPRRWISSLPSATAPPTRNARSGKASPSPPIGARPTRSRPRAPMRRKASPFSRPTAALRNRIMIFAALPFDTLGRVSLQAVVDDIGREAEQEQT